VSDAAYTGRDAQPPPGRRSPGDGNDDSRHGSASAALDDSIHYRSAVPPDPNILGISPSPEVAAQEVIDHRRACTGDPVVPWPCPCGLTTAMLCLGCRQLVVAFWDSYCQHAAELEPRWRS
jgi:hypothetical protein